MFRKILSSCRYDPALMVSIGLVMAGLIGLGMEGQKYVKRFQEISALRTQIQKIQAGKKKKQAQADKPVIKGLSFEGVFQKDGVLYAVIEGRLLKASDRIRTFQVLDINPRAVNVRNLDTGETIHFILH